MICVSMIDRMLEADLDQLTGHGSSPLGTHLRECARCRAVAAQIIRQTGELGRLPGRSTMHIAPRTGTIGRVPRYAAVGIAAATVVLAGRGIGRFGPPLRDSDPKHTNVAVGSAVAPADVSTAHPAAPPRASVVGRAPGGRPPPTSSQPSVSATRHHPIVDLGQAIAISPARASEVMAVTTEPVVVAAVPRVDPVLPARLDPSPIQSLGGRVAVDPPAGTRANIIRTANPGVTVVWLY